MLIAAEQYQCTEECLTIAAMLVYLPVFSIAQGQEKFTRIMHESDLHLERQGDARLSKLLQRLIEARVRSKACVENYVQIKSMKRARDIRAHN